MEKEDLIKLEEVNQRSIMNTKRLSLHEERLVKLENVYIALTKMDSRVESLESSVGEIKSGLNCINEKTNTIIEEKSKKWEKLIDYLFYSVIAFALVKLGLK